jgi:hypothetical protein
MKKISFSDQGAGKELRGRWGSPERAPLPYFNSFAAAPTSGAFYAPGYGYSAGGPQPPFQPWAANPAEAGKKAGKACKKRHQRPGGGAKQ